MNKTPSPFKTYARFKPISTKENDICINSLITSTQNSISIDTQSFPFTKVFKSSQAEIFDALLPSIIKDCINGYDLQMAAKKKGKGQREKTGYLIHDLSGGCP